MWDMLRFRKELMSKSRLKKKGKTVRNTWARLRRTRTPTLAAILTIVLVSGVLAMRLWSSGNEGKNDNAKSSELVQKYFLACDNDPCIWQGIQDITAAYGPEISTEALETYQRKYASSTIGDPHEWSHVVGRQTAASFGVSGKAFLRCPTTFNYGCMHGFFEKVLGETDSAKEAIDMICGQLETDSSYSDKFKFYCYHGVGHGIMQSMENDLTGSLKVCDSLDTVTGQRGCWQGVFMENINSDLDGTARKGVFLADEPLAPCSKMDSKYQHECYINHSAHLMKHYKNDVSPASAACLKATPGEIEGCMESIGLLTTNSGWQAVLLGSRPGDAEEGGWQLCKKFPADYIDNCVGGAVDHILQMDELETDRADKFCNLVEDTYITACYERIGTSLHSQTVDEDTVRSRCSGLSLHGIAPCLSGARL